MKKAFSLVLCALLLLPGVFLCRAGDAAQAGADGILRYYQQNAGVTNAQALVDGAWSDAAGRGVESLVLAAKQYKTDLNLSGYAASLKRYLSANTVDSATSRELMALMLVLSGVPDGYIIQTLNEAPGKLGVMSWVYALHLLNNGYTSTVTTLKATREKLLALRLSDGGWAVSGSVSDVDVTAMTVTALAPAYRQDSAVTAAIDGAVRLLSERQNDDGTLSSYGVKNPESISQTIIALSALGLDAAQDSRFIKNGISLFDALGSFRLPDGSYCHKAGGESSSLATVQAFSAYVAAYRQANGLGSLYYVPPSQRPTVTQPATVPNGGNVAPVKTTRPTVTEPQTEPQTEPAATVPQTEPTATAAPSGTATTRVATQPAEATPTTTGGLQTQQGTTAAALASTASRTEPVSEASSAFADESAENSTDESTQPEYPGDAVSSAEAEPTSGAQPQPPKQKRNIKTILLIAIWALAAAACAVLFLLGKRNKSWFIAVLLAAVVLTAGTLATSIQRREEFFSVPETASNAETITVSLAVRCDPAVAAAADHSAIPADGVILETSEIALQPGSTAYDQLLLAAKQNGFTFINKSAADSDYKDAYISTLAGLSEFDHGENSGWLFAVNGQFASVGCGAYELKDGDKVVWYYTCNYVEDMTKDFSALG